VRLCTRHQALRTRPLCKQSAKLRQPAGLCQHGRREVTVELLFVAILPGWNFGAKGRVVLPVGLPRRLLWRLWLTLAVCDAYALFTQGRTLRIMSLQRRQLLVQALATRGWPWLRGGLTLARSTALLVAQSGPQPTQRRSP
jgi:hypothetical protein